MYLKNQNISKEKLYKETKKILKLKNAIIEMKNSLEVFICRISEFRREQLKEVLQFSKFNKRYESTSPQNARNSK